MEAELPIATYARILFRCKEKEHIALLGKALPSMRYLCGGEIAGMHISAAQIREAGATSEHADGVVDYAIDASGVKIAYFCRETEEGCVKCSLRALAPLPGGSGVGKIRRRRAHNWRLAACLMGRWNRHSLKSRRRFRKPTLEAEQID